MMNKTQLKKWALDNSELIHDINKYISGDNLSLVTKSDLLALIETFPQFIFIGKAHRFLSQPKEHDDINLEKNIYFNQSLPNLSWSIDNHAYKSVLRSYSLQDQTVFLFEAHIELGFNLIDFALFLWKSEIESFNSSIGLLERETEILVLKYSNLNMVDKFHFNYKDI